MQFLTDMDMLDCFDLYLLNLSKQSPESLTNLDVVGRETPDHFSSRSLSIQCTCAQKRKHEGAKINFLKHTAVGINWSARARAGRFALCFHIVLAPVKLSSPLLPQLLRQLFPF